LLNGALDGPTAQMVTDRMEKDYTRTADKDLSTRLQSCIYL
jgi:hypothetical protein